MQDEEQLLIHLTVGQFKRIIRQESKLGLPLSVIKPDPSELWTRQEVADYYNVTLVTIDSWSRCRILPPKIKMGRRVYFNKQAVLDQVRSAGKGGQAVK